MVDKFDPVMLSNCAAMRQVHTGSYVLHSEYAALEARIAELEKDAARYRWLLGCAWTAATWRGEVNVTIYIPKSPVSEWVNEDDIGHLIDNAIMHNPDESEA